MQLENAQSIVGMARPIIVEFVGIAGSGKTSISRAVVDRLEARGISVGSRPQARGGSVRHSLIRRPRAAWAWSYTIRCAVKDSSARREHLRKMYTRLGRIISLAVRYQVVVMDEGIIHRFRALRRDSGAPELSIAEAAKPLTAAWLFPLEPSLLVLVQTDVDSIGSRLRSRDGRKVQWTRSEVCRSDAQSLRDIDQVLAVFPCASKMIVSNRFAQDVSLRAAEIANKIERILAQRGHR